MLNLNSLMIGAENPASLSAFYEKVLERKPDMVEDSWYGWNTGSAFFSIGKHDSIHGKSKEPERIIMNFETKDVRVEFKRIKELGAVVIKEPYDMGNMVIATFTDPEGNYFQLMSPWKTDAE